MKKFWLVSEQWKSDGKEECYQKLVFDPQKLSLNPKDMGLHGRSQECDNYNFRIVEIWIAENGRVGEIYRVYPGKQERFIGIYIHNNLEIYNKKKPLLEIGDIIPKEVVEKVKCDSFVPVMEELVDHHWFTEGLATQLAVAAVRTLGTFSPMFLKRAIDGELSPNERVVSEDTMDRVISVVDNFEQPGRKETLRAFVSDMVRGFMSTLHDLENGNSPCEIMNVYEPHPKNWKARRKKVSKEEIILAMPVGNFLGDGKYYWNVVFKVRFEED